MENEPSVTGRRQIIGKVAGSLTLTLSEIDIHCIEDLGQRSGLNLL